MGKIKLTKLQQKAIDFFKVKGYMALSMPRRSGKTTLLQEIIKRNPQSRIGVMCPSYETYTRCYKQFKNCHCWGPHCTKSEKAKYNEKPDIILADGLEDEYKKDPLSDIETVVALTQEWFDGGCLL